MNTTTEEEIKSVELVLAPVTHEIKMPETL